MTTVRIVTSLKYGLKFLGFSLLALLVSGGIFVGGLTIAGEPAVYRSLEVQLNIGSGVGFQTMLVGLGVSALGALVWLWLSFGLLYKLVADGVAAGVAASSDVPSPAQETDADETDAESTFAAGDDADDSTFGTDTGESDSETAREPPAATTSSDDDVLTRMDSGASSDEDFGTEAGADTSDTMSRGSSAADSRDTDPGEASSDDLFEPAKSERATADDPRSEAVDDDPASSPLGGGDMKVSADDRRPDQSGGADGTAVDDVDERDVGDDSEEPTPGDGQVETPPDEPDPGYQREIERENRERKDGETEWVPEEGTEGTEAVDDGEPDDYDAREYDERGYPRREDAEAEQSATGAGDGTADDPSGTDDGLMAGETDVTSSAEPDADPLNEPAEPPEPSDEFVERTEGASTETDTDEPTTDDETVPMDEPLTDEDPSGADGDPLDSDAAGDDAGEENVPLDEPIDDAGDSTDETVPLDDPIDDAETEDAPLNDPIDDADVEDTTDEPGDWEPLDESDLKD